LNTIFYKLVWIATGVGDELNGALNLPGLGTIVQSEIYEVLEC